MSQAQIITASHVLDLTAPLPLDGGQALDGVRIAYETYGTLNADKSNAVLIFHALTGDQCVASPHPVTGKPGWWIRMVGPGKPIDTDRFFVVCANVLGGCMGSTGPADIDPSDGKPYGLNFPVVTIRDMVRAQLRTPRMFEYQIMQKARADKDRAADANRAKFGRTKAEKQQAEKQRARETRALDQSKLDD